MTIAMLFVAVLLLAANAFFVAVEFALVGSRRARIEQLAEAGSRRARRALASMSDLQRQLAGAQLGITMASVALGYVAESALAESIGSVVRLFADVSDAVVHGIAFPTALALVAFLHMLLGEMVPKNLAIAGPEQAALWLAPAHHVFVRMLQPVIWALYAMAVGVVKLLGLQPKDEIQATHTSKEFLSLFRASRESGLIHDFDLTLLEGAVHFRERHVEAILIPDLDVVAMPRSAPVTSLEEQFLRTGHSRLPLYETGLDDVVGFIHTKDLLGLSEETVDGPVPEHLIREVLTVAPDSRLGDVLVEMRRGRIHLAVVRDEHARTLGIVTLEDIVEQLVGDIRDETDRPIV